MTAKGRRVRGQGGWGGCSLRLLVYFFIRWWQLIFSRCLLLLFVSFPKFSFFLFFFFFSFLSPSVTLQKLLDNHKRARESFSDYLHSDRNDGTISVSSGVASVFP